CPQQLRQIKDRHLQRKRLHVQEQARIQAADAKKRADEDAYRQKQADTAHRQQQFDLQMKAYTANRQQQLELRRQAMQKVMEDAQQARLADAQLLLVQEQRRLQEMEARRQAAERAEEARIQARLQRRQRAEERMRAVAERRRERRIRAKERRRPPPMHLQQRPLLAEFRIANVNDDRPRLAVATVGPVCMSPSDARAVERLRGTWVDNTTPRTISSDGAMIKSGTAAIAMAFGVADLTQPELVTVQGRTDGYASSAKAELVELLAAIISAPPDQNILVELDNESVVDQYQ
ncbi:hypothetical protein BGZ72_002782, partial [Mortierella alpina]